MQRTIIAVHQVFAQYFAIFFTSEIFLRLILTAAAEYLTLRLATDQCQPKPSKNSIKSLSRRSFDQVRLLRYQLSFLPFSYITILYYNTFTLRIRALSCWWANRAGEDLHSLLEIFRLNQHVAYPTHMHHL